MGFHFKKFFIGKSALITEYLNTLKGRLHERISMVEIIKTSQYLNSSILTN